MNIDKDYSDRVTCALGNSYVIESDLAGAEGSWSVSEGRVAGQTVGPISGAGCAFPVTGLAEFVLEILVFSGWAGAILGQNSVSSTEENAGLGRVTLSAGEGTDLTPEGIQV